jgi:cell division protein FtsB
MANRKLRKVKDSSSRNLIQRLRKSASPHRQYLIRTGVFLIVVIGLYSFLGGEFGFLNLLRMERSRDRLEMEKRELTAEIVDLEIRCKRLLSDSLLIQKLAREKYGLARDGEVIIRVPEDISYRSE